MQFGLNRFAEAASSIERGISFGEDEAWAQQWLGNVYRNLGRHDDAIAAYNKAIEFDPKDAATHATLAGCYRKQGLEDEYSRHIQIAQELIANETTYNRACFQAICRNVDEALTLLRETLEKRQTSIEWARHDPDFDFIRDDPRFAALLDEMAARK